MKSPIFHEIDPFILYEYSYMLSRASREISEKSPYLKAFAGSFLLSIQPLKTANWLQNTFFPDFDVRIPGIGLLIKRQS